jgi:hypothetical protein
MLVEGHGNNPKQSPPEDLQEGDGIDASRTSPVVVHHPRRR